MEVLEHRIISADIEMAKYYRLRLRKIYHLRALGKEMPSPLV